MIDINFQSVFAVLLATVIIIRVVCVLFKLDRKRHAKGYAHFSGFGYSYVMLGGGAMCGVMAVLFASDLFAFSAVWLFLGGSAGLILFDRRHRRHYDKTALDKG